MSVRRFTRIPVLLAFFSLLAAPSARCQEQHPARPDTQAVTVLTPAHTRHEMIRIPSGWFTMGSKTGDLDEKPEHRVYLDAYQIDKFEVTNTQYLAFLKALGKNVDSEGRTLIDLSDPFVRIRQGAGTYKLKSPDYAQRPVVDVSWFGASAYCKWMGGRLPTEAEWEKAARGTDGRTYPWGEEAPDDTRVNFGEYVGRPTNVGRYPKGESPYGLCDMAGNVWEWTQDWYATNYYATSPDTNPKGSDHRGRHVLRGGSWSSSPSHLRTTDRVGVAPLTMDATIGFRCVRQP